MLFLGLVLLIVILIIAVEFKTIVTKSQVNKYLNNLSDTDYTKTALVKPTENNGLLFNNKFSDGSVLLLKHADNTVSLPQSDGNETYYLSGIDFTPRKELFVLDGTGATNKNFIRPFMHLVKPDLSDEVVVEIKADQGKVNELNTEFGVSEEFLKNFEPVK
ncbi:hypothetical protein ACQW5G_07155 [Fructilactobacillus sp. Tb1]|uniref:hypothetical protein n=1 Tax=Fructilactobacillus sp. Tb1 TaxID=3422304 RepID=UPI003D2D8448